MKAILLSTSNILSSGKQSVSYKICEMIAHYLAEKNILYEILDLRDYSLTPCIGCGKCYNGKRCLCNPAFNEIYDKIVLSDCIFFVSPHYAPIPAKLSMLLEKMEEITFLHWWKDNSYKSEMYNLPAGIISHGGGADWALPSYKAMVNDTIANALDTIQCKIVPYNADWNTGISIPVSSVEETDSIFPNQNYYWNDIQTKLEKYITLVIQEL